MLSGFDGVRYGLTVPKKESKPGIKKGLSLFAEDDSEGEKGAVGRNIERQAQRKLADQKVRTDQFRVFAKCFKLARLYLQC